MQARGTVLRKRLEVSVSPRAPGGALTVYSFAKGSAETRD